VDKETYEHGIPERIPADIDPRDREKMWTSLRITTGLSTFGIIGGEFVHIRSTDVSANVQTRREISPVSTPLLPLPGYLYLFIDN
jgi:hypothetical protein